MFLKLVATIYSTILFNMTVEHALEHAFQALLHKTSTDQTSSPQKYNGIVFHFCEGKIGQLFTFKICIRVF